MAISSPARRKSIIGLVNYINPPFMHVDTNGVSQQERQTLLYGYHGIDWALPDTTQTSLLFMMMLSARAASF